MPPPRKRPLSPLAFSPSSLTSPLSPTSSFYWPSSFSEDSPPSGSLLMSAPQTPKTPKSPMGRLFSPTLASQPVTTSSNASRSRSIIKNPGSPSNRPSGPFIGSSAGHGQFKSTATAAPVTPSKRTRSIATVVPSTPSRRNQPAVTPAPSPFNYGGQLRANTPTFEGRQGTPVATEVTRTVTRTVTTVFAPGPSSQGPKVTQTVTTTREYGLTDSEATSPPSTPTTPSLALPRPSLSPSPERYCVDDPQRQKFYLDINTELKPERRTPVTELKFERPCTPTPAPVPPANEPVLIKEEAESPCQYYIRHPREILPMPPGPGPKNYYVVIKGQDAGVYNNWSDVMPLIDHIPSALFHGCKTFRQAHEIYTKAYDLGNIAIDPIVGGPYDNPFNPEDFMVDTEDVNSDGEYQ